MGKSGCYESTQEGQHKSGEVPGEATSELGIKRQVGGGS